MKPLRLAVICDYPEEGWESMDLCAQMLLHHLQAEHSDRILATPLCPQFRSLFQRFPTLEQQRYAFNADRLLNRFWHYPHYLKQHLANFDLFHVSDHTYAQLVHVLPPERTGVFCHDIDAFRSLVESDRDPRPKWYQAMSRRILDGLQKAAVVFYSTSEVRRQIEQYQLVERSRLVAAPYGTAPEFTTTPLTLATYPQLQGFPFILHVGSCIPRKRIDVLLEVFAGLRESHPQLKLVKVGGEWSSAHQSQIERYHLQSKIIHLQGIERKDLAALYQNAAAVLQTSEAEGFGFPIVEALACGSVVVASDIPVLREVGGNAILYCPVGDIKMWVKTINSLLENSQILPSFQTRLSQASLYSWSQHAQTIVGAYLQSSEIKIPIVV